MFLRRIFKGLPDLGPWVAVAEFLAALATLGATLMALNVVPSPFGGSAVGTVSGIVTDVKTGRPVPEAGIQVIDAASQVIASEPVPDAKGGWKTEPVKPGNYVVKAICDGYRPAAKNVSVIQGKTRVVQLALTPRSGQADETAEPGSDAPGQTVQTRVVVERSTGGPPLRQSGGGGDSDEVVALQESKAATASPKQASVEQQVENLIAEAKRLNNAGKSNDAVDKLTEASNLDPSDGRIYALALKIRISQGNFSDARDWYKDGLASAKKHADTLKDAGELLK